MTSCPPSDVESVMVDSLKVDIAEQGIVTVLPFRSIVAPSPNMKPSPDRSISSVSSARESPVRTYAIGVIPKFAFVSTAYSARELKCTCMSDVTPSVHSWGNGVPSAR